MAFAESFTQFFADFGDDAVLDGVAVRGILDVDSPNEFEAITQGPSFLLQPTTAVTPAVGQALVANGASYIVRQVLKEPPDGAMQRLVLARG